MNVIISSLCLKKYVGNYVIWRITFTKWFLYARLETGRIMWLGMAGGCPHRFRTITLVLYIGSLPNLTTWFPCGRGRTIFILGSLGQGHHYYKYIFWQQGRFRTITLVLYIGSWTNLATWFPYGRGKPYLFWGQRSRSPLL